MATVRVNQLLDGTVYEAETCWYDTARWPEWVDELARVIDVQGDWPHPGSIVTWQSGPAGRGRVSERVTAFEPLEGYSVEVEDDSITGTQRVAFVPAGDGVDVQLSLTYTIKRRTPLTSLIDRLFVRPVMATSLNTTLSGFAAVLAESRHSGLG